VARAPEALDQEAAVLERAYCLGDRLVL